MIARTLSDIEVRAELAQAVTAAGSAAKWGEQHGASAKMVRAVLAGERMVPTWFYPALGLRLERVVVRERAA